MTMKNHLVIITSVKVIVQLQNQVSMESEEQDDENYINHIKIREPILKISGKEVE